MPLVLRRSQVQPEKKYAVKVKATERSVTEFHWTILSKKFKPDNVPLYSKALEFF